VSLESYLGRLTDLFRESRKEDENGSNQKKNTPEIPSAVRRIDDGDDVSTSVGSYSLEVNSPISVRWSDGSSSMVCSLVDWRWFTKRGRG